MPSVVNTSARAGMRRCTSAAIQAVTATTPSNASGRLSAAAKRLISWLATPSHHSRPHT